VAEQVKVDTAQFARYVWLGRTIERHRVQIRAAFGFREFSRGDEPKIARWLAEEVCPGGTSVQELPPRMILLKVGCVPTIRCARPYACR